jgi:excinuclease ABC subunit C
MLPEDPGVYQYFDTTGKIIYVGKAKNLKKRVSSYFNKEHTDSNKTRVLVKNIVVLKYIVVDTEYDALLLENTLIKKHQPRYNILLKDDKTYPWICIKNEPFPRVFSTRILIKDGSQYFGPYPSGDLMYLLLNLIRGLYQLRNCSLQLTQNNIENNKFKVCLEYHLNNCKAPCVGKQTSANYAQDIADVKEILKGNSTIVLKHLESNMFQHAAKLEFERAESYKRKIELLKSYQSKSTVVSSLVTNVDVFSYADDMQSAYVNFMRVVNGAIVHLHTIELRKKLDETREELLSYAIVDFRTRHASYFKDVLLPFEIELNIPEVLFSIPQRGDKKSLLDLSQKNVEQFRRDKQKQIELTDPETHINRIMQQMMKDLRLTVEPRLIECFDNSNIQGEYAVSAMTVFRNGKPSKKDYRHFNVKTVIGPDDFATMEEVVYRRYKRVLEEKLEMPQLIVIDGGKGQLGAALNSLEKLGLRGKVGIIGIAKRLEEIYFPGDSIPLHLDKRGESLKTIQQIRDEAHRFGITHHRQKRSKAIIKTELDDIKGISTKTSESLLKYFKSVANIKQKSEAELSEIIGLSKAKLILNHFKQ